MQTNLSKKEGIFNDEIILMLKKKCALTQLCNTFVNVHATGVLRNGKLNNTKCNMSVNITYVNHVPLLFNQELFGFTSLCATPTFILYFNKLVFK